MNHKLEKESLTEALSDAEYKLMDTNLLMNGNGEDLVERSELYEMRDALQVLIHHTKSFLDVNNAVLSEKAKEADAKKIKRLERKLRNTRYEKKVATKKVQRMKRKLNEVEHKLDRLKPFVNHLEPLSDEEGWTSGIAADFKTQEWTDLRPTPPDSPHLRAYEALILVESVEHITAKSNNAAR
ncbi:unnamed protein product [Agarophyton chilense]